MGLLKTRYCRKKKKRKKEIAGIFVHCRVHCRAVMKELTLTFFLTAPAFTVTTVKKLQCIILQADPVIITT